MAVLLFSRSRTVTSEDVHGYLLNSPGRHPRRPHSLPGQLPTSSTAEPDQKLVLSVSVKEEGAPFPDNVPVSLDRLQEVLQLKHRQDPQAAVQLFADRRVSYQHVL